MELVDIISKVKDVLKQHKGLKVKDTEHNKNLKKHFDSLDTDELVMALEDEFDIEISDDDWEEAFDDKAITVNAVSSLVEKLL